MKAVITGTPVQIEGEPAEIAQLVELLSAGAVMVEHVHTWKLGLPDDNGVCHGRCWCGTERDFAPWGETATKPGQSTAHLGMAGSSHNDEREREGVERRRGGSHGKTGPRPLCMKCNRKHKPGNCKTTTAAAA
jgi:hypothetical protein